MLRLQVFNEKTVAALKSLQEKLDVSEGTVVFVKVLSSWFTIMNVKDKFRCVTKRDPDRQPWTRDCSSFAKLEDACDLVSACTWEGTGKRASKLTKQTSEAFIVSTKACVEAANVLLIEKGFSYVLPGIFSDDGLEKFFGQARQRSGGNFYIDVCDIMSAAKVKNLSTLIKSELVPERDSRVQICDNDCTIFDNPKDVEELLHEVSIEDTELLLRSNDPLRHKVVFVAGHLVYKHGKAVEINDDIIEEEQDKPETSEFLAELNRGGLTVPRLSTVHFVHAGHVLYEKTQLRCRRHLANLLFFINSPIACSEDACRTLANILLKAYVLSVSDKKRVIGCLRRKEKLLS